MIQNFFESSLLENKRVFLIANNVNIDKNAIPKLKESDVVIRFGNDKHNLQKTICKGHTDYMIYRSNKTWFNGFKASNIKGDNQIFLIYDNTNSKKRDKTFELKTINKPLRRQIKKCNKQNRYVGYISSVKGYSPSQGFGFLIKILRRMNCKKIILCGFTNLARNNVLINEMYGVHNMYLENKIFKRLKHKNQNIMM